MALLASQFPGLANMSFVRNLHVILAYVTVFGFALRAIWAFIGSSRLKSKPARILPHIVDTLLLVCGLVLVFGLGHSLTSPHYS